MFRGYKVRPYCMCAERGDNGTKYHGKQSKRRFVALDINGNKSNYIIQPCVNHANNYAAPSAQKYWKELK